MANSLETHPELNSTEGTPRLRPRRVLVIDDKPEIHEDFRKIFCSKSKTRNSNLAELESQLFAPGKDTPAAKPCPELNLDIVSAHQGQEGYELALQAAQDGLTSAASAIGDTDFAVATAELNRQQVLIQASIQLLGIANAQAAQILALF